MAFVRRVISTVFQGNLTLLWGLLSLCHLSGLARGASPDQTLEYKVKGGYLFNFARFVDWPVSALPTTNSPFVIGVLDAGEALAAVQSVLQGKNVNGHPVQVRSLAADSIGSGAHVLFVTRAAGKTPAELLAAIGGHPTLLVGETDQFAEFGGMVGFTLSEGSVRLSLNLERTEEVGLKVSSKFASVAKLVKTRSAK